MGDDVSEEFRIVTANVDEITAGDVLHDTRFPPVDESADPVRCDVRTESQRTAFSVGPLDQKRRFFLDLEAEIAVFVRDGEPDGLEKHGRVFLRTEFIESAHSRRRFPRQAREDW